MERIPVAGPSITAKEIEFVAEACRRGWYLDANLFQNRFEDAFARHLGLRYAIALPSCTSAIHLALASLNIGPGDEVIVPELTWIASAAPITYVGATPVFADVDATTWCISASSLEQCITRRTKAVIPVDLYGGVPDWSALREIASTHGIAIIEDAAQAIGTLFRGRPAGSFGDIGVFSFHGSKTLTTGEGGMLVTDREDIRDRVLVLRDHGRRPHDKAFWNREVAFKYKMSGLQAALGLAQLERLDELVAKKRQIFSWYSRRLAGQPSITLNAESPDANNAYWMTTAIVDSTHGRTKDELMQGLAQEGIESRPLFHPLSSLPAYQATPQASAARAANPVAYALSPYGLNLPSALSLTQAEVDRVCDTFLELLLRS